MPVADGSAVLSRCQLALLLSVASCAVARPLSAQSRRMVEHPPMEAPAASALRLDGTVDLQPPRLRSRLSAPHGRSAATADGWTEFNTAVSAVFFRFFSDIAPNSDGVERPSVNEHMYDAMVAPLAGQLSYVILGAGNNHLLTSTYFYKQYDGIAGLRYGFVPPSAGSPFQFSLTGSPLHGSLSTVTRHMGVVEYEPDPMPQAILLGGAVGLDFTYTSDAVRFEARAYWMPEIDTGHTYSTGVSQMQSLQLVFPLTRLLHVRPDLHLDLTFVGMHIERGDARAAIYGWTAQGIRPVSDMRELYQAMIEVTIRHD